MKHAIIVAHPNPRSLTCALADRYAARVQAMGQSATVRDLYRMKFDPCLKASEIPTARNYHPAADVAAERSALADVDVFVFVYPLWFNAPPAMLKGYVDRVFGMGFGYEPGPGGTEPMLEGKALISFTLSGAPEEWARDTGALSALDTVFDRHLAQMSGLRIVDHVHAGGVVSAMNDAAVAAVFAGVDRAVDAHFGTLAQRAPLSLRSAT
jgi:NAD(P)H dehydrogenase (quinone)